MGTQAVTKKYSTFVKGLITEASALNFPENASLDEDNFHLHVDGSRERRLGMDYESGYVKTTATLDTYSEGEVSFYSWEGADDNPDKNFIVVQTGNHIHILEATSTGYGAAKLDLEVGVDTPSTGYFVSTSNIASHPFSFASINGVLFCAQATSKPFYIKYDTDADSFTVNEYALQVRDIWGVPFGVATSITNRPLTLAGTDGWLHRYNLANQGWPNEVVLMSTTTGTPPVSGAGVVSANPIEQTVTDLGYAPALSDSFYLAHGLLNTSVNPQNVDVYRPDMLTTNPLLSLQLPKGKFIINAFEKNRAEQLGTSLSGGESQDKGTPTVLETFAGRVWYGGIESSDVSGALFDDEVKFNSTLFFSQILETLGHAAKCYQETDPTSREFSDILDTDGGTIELAGAGKIQRILSMHNFLVILADNGVWTVTGGVNGFTANSYSVRQVSNVGCISGRSAVLVEGTVAFWSQAGIYSVAVDAQAQDIRVSNITESTIQTRYSEIAPLAKKYVIGYLDAIQRRVTWSYSDETSFDGINDKWKKTKEISFDTVLKAWVPSSISPLAANSPYVMGAISTPDINLNNELEDVQENTIDVEANGVQVQAHVASFSDQGTNIVYIVGDGSFFTVGNYNNESLLDWETEDGTGIDYVSYLVTGYENLDEFGRNKQAVYLTAVFERTEENFIDDGAGGAILDNQSACTLQARWDWADHSNSGKWGLTQEVYRLKRMYTPTGTLPAAFDNGHPVTVTKNKLRGKGRSSHLKFTSKTGKKIHLLGWQIEYKGKDKV